jgi:Tfp pilus assembly protein PilF
VVVEENGLASAIQKYDELKKAGSSRYAPQAESLIILGFKLLLENKPQEAVEIMNFAVREFPHEWKVFDGLAEFYALMGEKSLAIAYYEKALELNPSHANTKEKLKKLKG